MTLCVGLVLWFMVMTFIVRDVFIGSAGRRWELLQLAVCVAIWSRLHAFRSAYS